MSAMSWWWRSLDCPIEHAFRIGENWENWG